jgi:hypothetical protein
MVLASFFKTNVLYCAANLRQLSPYVPDEAVDFFRTRTTSDLGDEVEVRSLIDRWRGAVCKTVSYLEIHRISIYV